MLIGGHVRFADPLATLLVPNSGTYTFGMTSTPTSISAEDRSSRLAPPDPEDVRSWEREFEAAAARPLEQRLKYAFIRTYKPVLDDAPFRAFETMREYREWCQAHLPDWLGYGRL